MTSREIILANMQGGGDVRPGMTFDNGRMNDMITEGPRYPAGYKQKKWIEGDVEYYDDFWGNIWSRMRHGCARGEVHKPLIDDWSKLDDFQAPKVDLDEVVPRLKKFAEGTDKFKLGYIPGWIFTEARYLRKMENYLLDMALYPDELKRMHSIIAKFYEQNVIAIGEAGWDAIFFCEDMGTQNGLLFSPAMWREYFKDDYTRLFSLAHDYGMKVFMHSCGQNWEILPDLLDAGVDCFEFGQVTVYNMPELAKLLKKHKAALWAPTDMQKILPTGDRKLIESATKEMLETFQGCLICNYYSDLKGIGVKEEWDKWAYDVMLEYCEKRK